MFNPTDGIPLHKTWMKETGVWNKPRSKELKALDEAIQEFSDGKAPASRVRQFYNAWKAKEGPHWMKSVRNASGIITAVDRYFQLSSAAGPPKDLSQEAKDAWKLVTAAARENCKDLLKGRELTVQTTAVVGTLLDIRKAAAKVTSAVDTVHTVAGSGTPLVAGSSAANASHQLLSAAFDGADIHHVMDALGPTYHEVLKALTPFIGMVTNGAKAAVGWAKVIKQGWDMYKLGQIAVAFAPGDPDAAFEAILVIVKRNLQAQIGDASISTSACASSLLPGL
jgi:hypothetical protein